MVECTRLSLYLLFLQYTSSDQVLIVLPEIYSEGWIAFSGDIIVHPISLDGGIATGFILPPGKHTFTIYYSVQTYLDIGYIITLIGYSILVPTLIYRYYKKTKNI